MPYAALLRPLALAILFLAYALTLPGALAHEAGAQRYTSVSASPDGIGKVFLGREIAQVMGFHGAPWLERPERRWGADGAGLT